MNGQNMKVMRKLDVWLDDYANKRYNELYGQDNDNSPMLRKATLSFTKLNKKTTMNKSQINTSTISRE